MHTVMTARIQLLSEKKYSVYQAATSSTPVIAFCTLLFDTAKCDLSTAKASWQHGQDSVTDGKLQQ